MLQKFYWGTIRKSVIAFGNLFNNIFIDRRDAEGNVVQTLKVPLSYAPRQKFLARIKAEANLPDEKFQIFLPRMAFEMTGIVYDAQRRVSLVQNNRVVNNTANTLNTQYAPTPYNVNMLLYVYTKNQDDGLQIVEQILPYFNPEYNLSLNAMPALGIKNDLPIILNSVDYEDTYEGDFTQRRAIVWTFNFTLKLNFFGPISKQGIIRSATVNTYSNPELTARIQRYNAILDPLDAKPDDDFDIIETFEDF
jgi:hypothetical protein